MLSILLALAQPAPCEARLLSYADWKPAPNQAWDLALAAPGGGAVVLIGAEHLRDPQAPQFAHIAARFAAARPSRVFFEGPDRGTETDADTAIRNMGESGYLRFLAKQANIPATSLEPSPIEQLAGLRGTFSDERILLFFLLREAARLRDREGKAGDALDAAVTNLLARSSAVAERAGLQASITDVASLAAAAAREWPGRDWRTLPGNWFSPLGQDPDAGYLTAINAANSSFRNLHMLRLFTTAARQGDRVFVVVGRNHVPMLDPALRCALAG